MTGPQAQPSVTQPPPFPAFDQALALHQSGQLAEACSAYEAALAEQPDHVPSLVNIAVVMRRLGRLDPSLRYLYRALELDPKQPGMWQNLGETLRRLKRFDEAVASFKKASQDDAVLLVSITGMALALKEAGQFDEALQALERLLVRDPANVAAWGVLGDVLFDAGQDDAAQAALERAIRLQPHLATHHIRLAFQKAQRGHYREAEGIYRALIAQGADGIAFVHVGLAQTLISQGRLDEAEAPLARAIERDSTLIDAYLARARLNFLAGRLGQAWIDYAWRKRHIDFTPPHLPVPDWDGTPLDGRSILLLGEQGAGDTIQFLRYLPMLKASGASRVVLATAVKLKPLVEAMPGLDEVVSDGKSLPKTDVYAHLLDLPALFKTELATIPVQSPYLPAPKFKERLKIAAPPGTRLKVGIAFQGNPRHRGDRLRSLSFEKLAPLFGCEGAAFYSLQVGHELPAQAKPFLDSGLLTDLGPLIGDFDDTACLLMQLDLVISVDTALVHLAGALGKPVWMLLPFAPDWRWLLARSDSPWYPSLTIFRQPAANDWTGAVLNVYKALDAKLKASDLLLLPSAFKTEAGQPRFRMSLPKSELNDPGAAFLLKRESQFGGYEYATRAFLDAHMRPGDLMLDIGAHWGVMALHAASRWPGQVSVLAVEPDPSNASRLNSWASQNGLAHMIECVVAGCADKPGRGRVQAGGGSSMGFSVHPEANGPLALVSIDSLLAERPALADKRCFVKIDVEGLEPEAVAGMSGLIASGRVQAIILERGRNFDAGPARVRFQTLLNGLARQGFKLVRFANEQLGGPLLPFVFTEDLCNFIALAPGFEPLPSYPRHAIGPVIPPTQNQRARQTGQAKAKRTMALKGARSSDAGFWADPENLSPLALERAREAAALLPRQGRVLELGAGLMRLRASLGPDVAYVAADLVPWTPDTLAVDLNQDQFPAGRFDAIALLEVLEYLHEPEAVLAKCRQASDSLVLTYRVRKHEKAAERRAQGWFNDFDETQLQALLKKTGWRADLSFFSQAADTQVILAKPGPEQNSEGQPPGKHAK